MHGTRCALRARLAACCAARLGPPAPTRLLVPAPRTAGRASRYASRARAAHVGATAVDDALAVAAAADGEEDADDLAADIAASAAARGGASGAAPARDSRLVLGIDPDVRGAIAALRWTPAGGAAGGNGGALHASASGAGVLAAEVFDTPAMEVMVGSGNKARIRLRHDPAAMVALLASLRAPRGTLAVLERPHARAGVGTSAAFQSGCGLGLWWGVLTAQGFTVRLALPRAWKSYYSLVGKEVGKDDSRATAAAMFDGDAGTLTRKRDHGRAEALLIAAYGVLDAASAAGEAASAGGAPGVEAGFAADVLRRREAAASALEAAGGGEAVLAAAVKAVADAKAAARAAAKAAAAAAKAAARAAAKAAGPVRRPRKVAAAQPLPADAAAPAAPASLAEMREAARQQGLRVSGTKAQLAQRLAEAAAAAAAAAPKPRRSR